MEVLAALRVLLVVVLLLVSVEHSECVQCFKRFNPNLHVTCEDKLGEMDLDNCCQNPHYGYQETDGECQSCGPPVWSQWTRWSECNSLCGDGVTQRSRKCFGIGQSQCDVAADTLQVKHCTGTCCDVKGWASWDTWSPCSVTCGGGSVRKRKRGCSSRPGCLLACIGPLEETEECPINTCPVHGGWSTWSGWAQCSGSCIDDQRVDVITPSRKRKRSCSSPAPSTVPPGNFCPGDDIQDQDCSELPNCPVDGSWGAWSPPGLCSVSCGVGLRQSSRRCDNPPPKYGGQFCNGSSSQTSTCQSPCPVDGFWSGWSSWNECSSSCIPQGQVPIRTRHRSCSNPGPSSNPPGRDCQGEDSQRENCNHLPHCSVHGSWGSWSRFSPCPVTCGVGLQVSVRKCDSPSPQHGGQLCPGEGHQTSICNTKVHCPVDGLWSRWTEWSKCEHPYVAQITCKTTRGSQTREHRCLYRAHNGSICRDNNLTDRRFCHDVSGCSMKSSWGVWEPWTLCKLSCDGSSERTRSRPCNPDYSHYGSNPATFFGKPNVTCPHSDEETTQSQRCINAPKDPNCP
ncbi:properdin-like [Enoplosus armatus]|uniref:properdin-like n=1 Tax=Enoplosus armatus TaxID=215367 RepID=UPI003992C1E6